MSQDVSSAGHDGDDDSDDEWGEAELDLSKKDDDAPKREGAVKPSDDTEEYWNTAAATSTVNAEEESSKDQDAADSGEPMILVNLTRLSDGQIHCRFDPNSVNDPEAVSKWRKTIQVEYDSYAKNTDLLADGTVVPCGSSVYRGALSQLRQEKPGEYFVPIFPPKTS